MLFEIFLHATDLNTAYHYNVNLHDNIICRESELKDLSLLYLTVSDTKII